MESESIQSRTTEEGVTVWVPSRAQFGQHLPAAFRSGLPSLQAARVPALVLDLAAAPLLDSTGLGGLVDVIRLARDNGVRLALARPSPALRRLLSMALVLQVVSAFDSVEEAVEALKG
jgi:anti-sigma B factor antagonist